MLAKLVAFAMSREETRKLAFWTISQIGIRYRESPLSEPPPGFPPRAPRGGDRFPWLWLKLEAHSPAEDLYARLDDTRFNLIVIGQPLPERSELPDLLLAHCVLNDPENDRALSRYRIPKPSFYLLRPDGHVGLAGMRLEAAALRRYLAERLAFRVENTN